MLRGSYFNETTMLFGFFLLMNLQDKDILCSFFKLHYWDRFLGILCAVRLLLIYGDPMKYGDLRIDTYLNT